MSKILEELWYGNISFENQYSGMSDEEKKLTEYISIHHENLYKTLNKQQKELLEKFDDCISSGKDLQIIEKIKV